MHLKLLPVLRVYKERNLFIGKRENKIEVDNWAIFKSDQNIQNKYVDVYLLEICPINY